MERSALTDQVRAVIDAWLAAWSPGAEPWNGDAYRALFKPGAGAIEVVDDMGGTTLTLDSVEAYIETWAPFMTQFSYWTIAPVGPLTLRVADDFAVASFSFVGEGRDAEGQPISPAPGQHATLVLEQQDGRWMIVREHLTSFTQAEA